MYFTRGKEWSLLASLFCCHTVDLVMILKGSFLFQKWTYHGHFISKKSKDENMQISPDLQWGNKQQI